MEIFIICSWAKTRGSFGENSSGFASAVAVVGGSGVVVVVDGCYFDLRWVFDIFEFSGAVEFQFFEGFYLFLQFGIGFCCISAASFAE